MPCWEVRTTNVVLKAENASLLAQALRAENSEFDRVVVEGGQITARHTPTRVGVTIRNGTAVVSESQEVADKVGNAVNRAYSREVLRKSASRFGWVLKEQSDGNFVAEKRNG